MTLILGTVDNGRVWLGADSAASATDSNEIYSLDTPKIFKIDPYVMGCSGSWHLLQILRYNVELPDPPEHDLDQFMSTSFVSTIRAALDEHGFQSPSAGWNFLVGVYGQIFTFTMQLEVIREVTPYSAIGSGRHTAYGALYALEGSGKSPRERMEIALKAAQKFDRTVREPFMFVETSHDASASVS